LDDITSKAVNLTVITANPTPTTTTSTTTTTTSP
jgi:hypothetical protein